MSNIKTKIMENNFKWTDKSVLAFNQVYSSNFESKLLAQTKCSYANYIGKKAEEKLEQFKKDWTEPRDKYIVVLQFDTNRIAYGSSRGQWSVRKEFNDLKYFTVCKVRSNKLQQFGCAHRDWNL